MQVVLKIVLFASFLVKGAAFSTSVTNSHKLHLEMNFFGEAFSFFKNINKKMDKMEENQNILYKKIDHLDHTLTKKIDHLDHTLNKKIESVKEEISFLRGETTERNLRALVKELNGRKFAQSFSIRGLSGLSRLMMNKKVYAPRTIDQTYKDETSEDEEKEKIRKKLLAFIYRKDNVKKIEAYFHNIFGSYTKHLLSEPIKDKQRREEVKRNIKEIKLPRKKGLIKLVSAFLLLDDKGKKSVLQNDSGIGLIFFSIASGLSSPVHELELDCRGDITVLKNGNYVVKVGEIKSSRKGAKEACEQLSVRLSIIEKAVKAVKGDDTVVEKVGILFCPSYASVDMMGYNLPKPDEFKLEIMYV